MAIAVKTDDVLHQMDSKTNLSALHQYFMSSYNSTAVTEAVKIKHCARWDLGTRGANGTFIYNPNLVGDIVVYMDDMLVATATLDYHLRVIERLFRVMIDNVLEIRLDKCKFLYTEIEYLGYLVKECGIRPTENGINAVVTFPVPQTKRELQRFLGLCSYFRKFIQDYSMISKPLSDLVKENAAFVLGETELKVFETLKSKLSSAPILAIYSPKDETELHCDASSIGYGAVLMQRKSDRRFHPIFYFSKRSTATEAKYHSYELETLAIVYALKRFRIYLQNVKFKIVTDCNSLTMTLRKKDINPRIARWALELLSYDYELEHRPGLRMRHVDALSRAVGIVEDNPFEWNLTICQGQDPKIVDVRDQLEKSENRYFELRNGLVYRKRSDKLLFYVPEIMKRNVIFKYHDEMGHLGVEKTSQAITQNYWFPKFREKVESHIRNCLKCIAYAPKAGKTEGFVNIIPKDNVPFTTLHVDHVGPIDGKNSVKRHILVVVDAFTKFVKLYAVKTTASKYVIDSLKQYFQSYSRPLVIVTDKGTCFTSGEFQDFLRENKIKHIKVATGSPQANGQVERVNRTLIPMLGKLSDESMGRSWHRVLSEVEYAINNSINRTTGYAPSRLLFGVNQRGKSVDNLREFLESLGDAKRVDIAKVRNDAADKILHSQLSNKVYADKKRKTAHEYKQGDLVMLRNFDSSVGASKKLVPIFKGPYCIKRALRNNRYLLSDVDGFLNTQRPYQGI